jgi:CheY-like chemotaxis protein
MNDVIETNRRAPRVLIVDDDPAAVKFLTDRCVKMGLTVQVATNGLHALIMARQNPPDALIVDVHMPELDGLSLCSRLLDPHHVSMEVIVISGYSDPGASERCGSLGAAYARKGPELWATIQSALSGIFPGMTVETRDAAKAEGPKMRERPMVLVVDDDPDVGKFLTSRLRKCGVDVLFATDGRRAYQIAVREKPSVILSDYFMPVANINFLLWRLRSTPGIDKTPVFAMSGSQLDRNTTETLMRGDFGQRGVEQIFRKPLNVDEVFPALQRYCAMEFMSPRVGDVRQVN